jgi:hypothetical protein
MLIRANCMRHNVHQNARRTGKNWIVLGATLQRAKQNVAYEGGLYFKLSI